MCRKRFPALVIVGMPGLVLVQGATLDRPRDPVVLVGAELPMLLGRLPSDIVAFRYEAGWQQIPMQIDERKFVEYQTVYNLAEIPPGFGTVTYADDSTYTGPDDDPTFDAEDELVFMAGDAGDRAPAAELRPAGIVPSSGVEVEISDPLDGGIAWVYLFVTDSALAPAAGQDYVTYTFNLLAGDYIPNYNTADGFNPEDSEVVTAHYRIHFADRWIRDEIRVLAGGATGVDILDRHKSLFGPGICSRTEDSFSDAEGAFFANIDGPIRGIRSYMGANSGPLTQREHFFYAQRHDVTTFLRVHAISAGVMDLYDYSPDAIGMVYTNDLNPAGVLLDGAPDTVATGPLAWEMVTGTQGTLIMSQWIETDIVPFAHTSYYSDDATPSVTQCTGDAFEYGVSGTWVNQAIPNTDPSRGSYNNLASTRVVYYEPPGQTVPLGQLRSAQARNKLVAVASAYASRPGDSDFDTDSDQEDFGHFQVCLTGPGIPQDDPACQFARLDADDDVDIDDFGILQRCISGANIPAEPSCTD